MKRANIYALAALMLLALSAASVYADQSCCPTVSSQKSCPTCPAPAWDRTPIYVQEPNDPYLPPTRTVQAVLADPWAICGAFCAAGQIPPGWPYGWGDQYWLRPDSSF